MLNLDTKSVRFLARMGARGTLGQALYDYASEGKEFYAVSADLVHASGFDRLVKEYPERVLDVGIAEQNMIGIAAGLAGEGTPVIATTWAMFASVRVADQVRNFMGFMQKNIKLIGMDSGFVQSRFSYSHANPPDIAIMRAIPGITIVSPCDGIELYHAIIYAMEHVGPAYIRLTGPTLQPIVHKEPYIDFSYGKSIVLKEGKEVALVATGNVVNNAVCAAKQLEENGISVKVIDMHTIRPLDNQMLESLREMELVVTIEEHLKNGGLGSAVAEYYSGLRTRPRHLILGVDDYYPLPSRLEYATGAAGLSADKIVDMVQKELNE